MGLVALYKSEQREAKKDTRASNVQNQLMESYDERVLAADRIAEALHGNAWALDAMVNEIRAKQNKIANQFRRIFAHDGRGDKAFTDQETLREEQGHLKTATESLSKAASLLADLITS